MVSARYPKGWIQGRAKIGRGRASPLTKSSLSPNVHSNILIYCRQHMHLFEYCHSGCLFLWLNCLLLVIRWAIKGHWASSYTSHFGFSFFFDTFGAVFFTLLNRFVWLRITDEGSVLEMRILSILVIKSDLKWFMHLSWSLFNISYTPQNYSAKLWIAIKNAKKKSYRYNTS